MLVLYFTHLAYTRVLVVNLQYNQKYIKGREGHDWLLRKNIWRRMRYRRENKKMVEELKTVGPAALTLKTDMDAAPHDDANAHSNDADAAAHAAAVAASKSSDLDLADQAAVEAAVAAAESFGKLDRATNGVMGDDDVKESAELTIHHHTMEDAAHAALDAAAQLAAAAGSDLGNDDIVDGVETTEV